MDYRQFSRMSEASAAGDTSCRTTKIFGHRVNSSGLYLFMKKLAWLQLGHQFGAAAIAVGVHRFLGS
jgi:hypothetical protein